MTRQIITSAFAAFLLAALSACASVPTSGGPNMVDYSYTPHASAASAVNDITVATPGNLEDF